MSESESRAGCEVLVVDDDELLCRGFVRFLEGEGHRCRLATSIPAAARILRDPARPRFEVVLLDLSLPGGDGAELIPIVEETDPAAAIAVISAKLDAARAIELWGRARIALPKPLPPKLLRELVPRLVRSGAGDLERFAASHALTPREVEVIRLALSGLSNKQIAGEVGSSEETVLTHWRRIFRKSGARGFREVVAAVRAGARGRTREGPKA